MAAGDGNNEGKNLTPGREAELYTGLITITKKRIGELRGPHP